MGEQNANALIPDVSGLQGTQAQYAQVLLTEIPRLGVAGVFAQHLGFLNY